MQSCITVLLSKAYLEEFYRQCLIPEAWQNMARIQ